MTDRTAPRTSWIAEWPGRADRYQAKALRLREEARRVTERGTRHQMLDIASQYERLASGVIFPCPAKAHRAGFPLGC